MLVLNRLCEEKTRTDFWVLYSLAQYIFFIPVETSQSSWFQSVHFQGVPYGVMTTDQPAHEIFAYFGNVHCFKFYQLGDCYLI